MKISKARLKEIIKEEVSAFKSKRISERLENESEISDVESAMDIVSDIVRISDDAEVIERAERAEQVLIQLLQKMYGAERAGV